MQLHNPAINSAQRNLLSAIDVVGLSPCQQADIHLAKALYKAGAFALIDAGYDQATFDDFLSLNIPHGLLVRDAAAFTNRKLSPQLKVVVLPIDQLDYWTHQTIPVMVLVVSAHEAKLAMTRPIAGLMVKGAEAGGRVGDEGAFVLIQHVAQIVQERADLLLWLQGGIGLHTAAAARTAGAHAVVLDNQLISYRDCHLPKAVKDLVARLDGGETVVHGCHRVIQRPGLVSIQMINAAQVANHLGVTDLATQLLPIGQDVALGNLLRQQATTLDQLVYQLRQSMHGHVRQAKALRPLAPHSAFAKAYNIEFPIAQGPMTRVSDTAEFAAAVANNGGLPFLALSLLREGQVRPLLEKTRELAGDKTWGAGVLGFAPAEVLEPQLKAILEFKPPVVLIAGGRPSQARSLEDAGIRAFLHVPAPSLLDMFIKEGARRFVFEGRECGGHVGPRMSFVLWEQQIHRLLAMENPQELEILFAGGIHDERSAAMVATLAAPLAARGAKIGVLMGTAYTLTEEAVSCGAVLPQFQQQALSGAETALLETAPGHAVRCLPTTFIEEFEETKRNLLESGKTSHQAWEELETLNVGRLRIATKGIIRDGDNLVDVGEKDQLTQGMYMIGQIVAMRSSVTTMHALHQQVASGGTQFLKHTAVPTLNAPIHNNSQQNEPIAIVGMACMAPGSSDLEQFWANILASRDFVTEVPDERWNKDFYYDPNAKGGEKSPSKWGGFLDKVVFNPLDYGIPPQSLAAIEPIQLLSLAVAQAALKDAGYDGDDWDRERASVILGTESGMDLSASYGFRNLYPQLLGEIPPELDAILPRLTEDSFPGILANVIAGRIANRLDLGGVNYTVDAACASSLAAIELAVKELRAGTSDLVLAGGADFHNSINDFLMFASAHALSRKGRCRSFDSEADGIALGEGAAIITLKRLSDAQRDGDRIYAVINAVAGSSDGKSLGLTAPRKDGQKRALERAYRAAGISPSSIGLVEAHGTGTIVGDRTEMQTMTEIFTAGGSLPGSAVLGSVKSQIGHTKCAAGVIGLIKMAKSIYHGVLPPTIHVNSPNPYYDEATSPFIFEAQPRPWSAEQRVAAVSAFGFGGTNFHAVLSQAQAEISSSSTWPAELFVFRGATLKAAASAVHRVLHYIDNATPARLTDLAAAQALFNKANGEGDAQIAIVAESMADLRNKLNQYLIDGKANTDIHIAAKNEQGKLAFLFSGQGSQYPGMARQLFANFAELQPLMQAGKPWLDKLFPANSFNREIRKAQMAAITDTRVAQPTLGIVELAIAKLLTQAGVVPDMSAGHSYGELAALCFAGAISEEELLPLSAARANAILDAALIDGNGDAGSMAAVSASAEETLAALNHAEGVVLANINAPKQTVIAGTTTAIEHALIILEKAGLAARQINVACAFHSPVIAGAKQRLANYLADINITTPHSAVYSNFDAQIYALNAEGIKQRLAEHVISPVRFVEQIEQMYADGARVFVEVGPGEILSNLVAKILGSRPHTIIATNKKDDNDMLSWLRALAALSVAGVNVDVAAITAHRAKDVLNLEQPKAIPPAAWWINGHRAWPIKGNLPPTAGQLITQPLSLARPAIAAPNAAAPVHAAPINAAPINIANVPQHQQPLMAYLQGMREMVMAQREVMMGAMGVQPVAYAAATIAAPAYASAAVADFYDVPQQAAPRATVNSAPIQTVQAAAKPAVDLKAELLAIVADRTGYPTDMLDLDLDLEADLSIDSIKRLEIIGELASKTGLAETLGAGNRDALVEQLAAKKTLRSMIEWLDTQVAKTATQTTAQAVTEVIRETAQPTNANSTSFEDIEQTLLAIVADRTGYPVEMLDPDLDLEADLSIDSIKRLEIIGELASKTGLSEKLGGDRDAMVEKLAAKKTLRAITEWLREQVPTTSSPAIVEQITHQTESSSAINMTDIQHTLLAIVAERTGYPVEMLELDLDLEADLSIDSIKRLEIIGELASKTGLGEKLGGDRDVMVEKLAAKKTLRSILDWLKEQIPDTPTATSVVDIKADIATEKTSAIPLMRFVRRITESQPAIKGDHELEGKRFLITDDGRGIAKRLAELLTTHSAQVELVNFDENLPMPDVQGVDGLIHLWAVSDEARARDVKRFFTLAREALLAGTSYVLVASGLGGSFGKLIDEKSVEELADYGRGGGLAGMVKTISQEFTELRAHWVDLDLNQHSDELAAYLELELLAENPLTEVGYTNGARQILKTVDIALPQDGTDNLQLDKDSVVLITGGARGITAKLAIELANRYHCQLELVGRSELPDTQEDAATLACTDLMSLRKHILTTVKGIKPADVEKRCSRILAEREVRQTFAAIEAAGSKVNYHAMDVRGIETFSDLINGIYERYGRLDGVVHGAGIIEDKLLRHKTDESFERVFDTKVRGAMMLSMLVHDDIKFVVFFSSVAGAFGNRGQVDYATANDMMDKISHQLQRRVKGRVVSVNWGPWASAGMVSAELEQEYHRRGIGLIPLDEGVNAVIDELRLGNNHDTQVVLMCATPESMQSV